ncbi:ATP-binding cassette domain-containing protein [Aeromicrobium halocynthiae]|uniref:ATP-binding cassette domain-containing protein n=1 Tax=Aeromicrobium halocynthiae TaxID=560557 RepID=A0ABP5HNP3_9ACTN
MTSATHPVGSGLTARIRSEERDVDLALTLATGETVAVLGPNGAGKSTLVTALAGLLRPDEASIRLDGTVLAGDGTWLPAHRRGVALLAQDALLFPHLDARENVAFGPRSAGVPRRAAREAAERWLHDLGVADLADRRPSELSGGQAQRVALARALATEPRLLLLDEPMAALDVSVAPEIRRLLRRVLADRTTILVTHDVLDALALADRVVVVEDGRVVEDGPTREVLTRPRSAFGARIAGLDLIAGSMRDGRLVTPDGLAIDGTPSEPLPDGTPTVAVVSPADVAVHLDAPGGSPRNTMSATITHLEPFGDHVLVRTDVADARITLASAAELDLSPGTRVHLVVKATAVALHPARPGAPGAS